MRIINQFPIARTISARRLLILIISAGYKKVDKLETQFIATALALVLKPQRKTSMIQKSLLPCFITVVHVSRKCILINQCTRYVHKGRRGCFSLINDVSVSKRIVKHLGYCLKAIPAQFESAKYITPAITNVIAASLAFSARVHESSPPVQSSDCIQPINNGQISTDKFKNHFFGQQCKKV